MNRERAHGMKALQVGRGIAFAFGNLDDGIFDAMAADDDEAKFYRDLYKASQREKDASSSVNEYK